MIDHNFSPLPEPYFWQREALTKWIEKNSKGTIDGATGVGKSMLAYMAIQYYKPKRVLIVVNTEGLQLQHLKYLIKYFPKLKREAIGLVGGGKQEFDKPITIAIVNSIRYDALKEMKYDLLIMDECHHYPAEVNKTFLEAGSFDKVLALSATPEREDGLHLPFLEKYPIVYIVPVSALATENTNDFILEIYCFDIIQKDRENINVILSDCQQILYDLYTYFINSNDYDFSLSNPRT